MHLFFVYSWIKCHIYLKKNFNHLMTLGISADVIIGAVIIGALVIIGAK